MRIILSTWFLVGFVSLSAASEVSVSPLSIVDKRMASYNSHDLEAFLSTYSEDVEIYTYPDTQLAKGKKHLKSIFEPLFKEGAAKVIIHHQFAKDSYVINHETVEYLGKETKYISIYRVEDGLISEVRFVRD